MNIKLHLSALWYWYQCFNIFLFDQLLSLLTFLCPKKSLYLFSQFSDKCHDSNKVFYEAFKKLCHPLNTWIYCGFLGGGMFIITCNFFGSSSFRSLEIIIKPKIIHESNMNEHLFGFKLMPYSLHFWKHNPSFYKWLPMSLYIIKSSKNIFIKSSKHFMNALVITL
jgi:hypothetical protein